MRITVGAATDIGQVREGNEDSFLAEAPLYAVADGMGGHRGGEVASNLALDTIHRLFERREGSLAEQVVEANRAVFERSQLDRAVAGMGTTLTAALVEGDRVRLAHVGDSRAYLLRGGNLGLLTEDHTLVHRMVQEGEITEVEAETHPHRSILTRALGVDPQVHVDEGLLDIAPGDRLLLCTDGLTGMVSDDEIRAILEETPSAQEAAERLVNAANQAGGVDNITAVILDFTEGEDPSHEAEPRATARPLQHADRRREQGDPRPGARPSPARPPSPTRILIRTSIALMVIVLVLVGVRLYLDSQWFVGVSDGRVAVFRGVPAEVAGIELHSVVVETAIPAEDATTLPLYRELEQGITARDREGAEAIVEQIRLDVDRVQQPGT